MSQFIKAKYDGKQCLLNIDYVMDMFEKGGHYEAYTMDFERGSYLIEKADFEAWEKETDEVNRWFDKFKNG